jgi:non-canonical purine NTP pyrophosphatase (RdgB/HAM1 family)
MIYFVTGNKAKLIEAKQIIPTLEGFDIDLSEIQEIDAHKIIEAKLLEAKKHNVGEFVVEDTSLYFDATPGLPGPLIKWFLKTIDNDGMADLVNKYDQKTGRAVVLIGYMDLNGNITYFEGSINGLIVKPRGNNGFGWDAIFQPDGSSQTFAEIDMDQKNEISMRKIAFQKLREFLNQTI